MLPSYSWCCVKLLLVATLIHLVLVWNMVLNFHLKASCSIFCCERSCYWRGIKDVIPHLLEASMASIFLSMVEALLFQCWGYQNLYERILSKWDGDYWLPWNIEQLYSSSCMTVLQARICMCIITCTTPNGEDDHVDV